ncbi:MAG: HAMP domain-containing sensor histidine kinase [Verrucomicrobia bacterium]|nr:HAMP domain-containing sensor histidine kinase [Verrucomicrobiota bacterium]
MKHTRSIWLVFLTCAAVVGAAMAVITHHALSLEQARLQAAGEAELGEKVRLALWRMDTEAAALLFAENNRAPSEFQEPAPTSQAGNPFDGNTQQMAPDSGGPPSPLLSGMPDHAILHFEINDSGVVSSPQVPATKTQPAATAPGMSEAQFAERAAALTRLRTLLGMEQNRASAAFNPNLSMAVAAANSVLPDAPNGSPGPADTQDAAARDAPQEQAKNFMQKRAAARKSSKDETATLNEYNSRQAIVQRAVQSNSNNGVAQQSLASNPVRMVSPAPPARPTQVTPYKALWLEGELFLVRAVVDGGGSRVQGVWLRRCSLADSLLATIRDLLPGATLIPFQPLVFTPENVLTTGPGTKRNTLSSLASSFTVRADRYDRAPLALVTLPWQLVPGEGPGAAGAIWSPLHTLLAVAWGCVVLAMLAVAVLLGGVVALSERRASFVSSVTHELRTPLTTFRLYSEMLAEDMIPEPQRRKAYLQTLQTEAARLTHLVENVLAYSRIERGSARARIEQTTVEALISRLVPRLAERAAAAGMQLALEVPPDLAALRLSLDVTAVEQILFNLVDNACKYAVSEDRQESLELAFARADNTLQIRLRDHGPGIPAQARKNLFKPFHKSAQEAATSQPGVGLGLSLSRRLARAIGGNLALETPTCRGTCFLLELPIV